MELEENKEIVKEEEEKVNRNRLLELIEERILNIFDIKSEKVCKFEIEKAGYNCSCIKLESEDFCSGQHVIFLSGGRGDLMNYNSHIKTTLQIQFTSSTLTDPETNPISVRDLKDMPIPLSFHSLIPLNQTTLYSVGGMNSTGYLNVCLKYSFSSNEWTLAPPLNQRKKQVGLCFFNNPPKLFAFGGTDKFKVFSTIETLNLQTPDAWQIIPLKRKAGWSARCGVAATQVSNNAIFIFGGTGKDESFLYDVNESKMDPFQNIGLQGQLSNRSIEILQVEGMKDVKELFVLASDSLLSYSFREDKWMNIKLS